MSYAVATSGACAEIGTNGSEDPMMAMFFAAYAAGDHPEVLRAANWVAPIPLAEYPLDYPQPDLTIRNGRKAHREFVKKLLYYRPQEQLWLGLARIANLGFQSTRTVERATRLKVVSDPVLRGLVRFYKSALAGVTGHPDPTAYKIPYDDVTPVLAGLEAVLPELVGTGFARRGQAVRDVFRHALEHVQDVTCG